MFKIIKKRINENLFLLVLISVGIILKLTNSNGKPNIWHSVLARHFCLTFDEYNIFTIVSFINVLEVKYYYFFSFMV